MSLVELFANNKCSRNEATFYINRIPSNYQGVRVSFTEIRPDGNYADNRIIISPSGWFSFPVKISRSIGY